MQPSAEQTVFLADVPNQYLHRIICFILAEAAAGLCSSFPGKGVAKRRASCSRTVTHRAVTLWRGGCRAAAGGQDPSDIPQRRGARGLREPPSAAENHPPQPLSSLPAPGPPPVCTPRIDALPSSNAGSVSHDASSRTSTKRVTLFLSAALTAQDSPRFCARAVPSAGHTPPGLKSRFAAKRGSTSTAAICPQTFLYLAFPRKVHFLTKRVI